MGTINFLHPASVFSDEAWVEKDEHFPEIQKLFLDPPVKVHRAIFSFPRNKKIPGPIVSIRGFPFFILKITPQPLTTKAVARL